MQGWGKIKAAANYAGISPRTLRDWIKSDLRHVVLPSGTILIKYNWIDEYLQKYEAIEDKAYKVNQIVSRVCQDMGIQ